MVVTHASVKKQKATPIIKKEDNKNRLYMTHAEAVADNARIKEEREKVAAFRASLRKETVPVTGTESVVIPVEEIKAPLSADKYDTISKLVAKKAKLKGPGSKAKKEALQAQIDAIEGRVHENIS